ncbi:MAG TPA: hypothetical protein VF598_00455 [Hymenobacter sp.]|jgi:hypothetical protein
MTLYQTPDVSLTYNPDTATLRLSYKALSLAAGFEPAYQRALEAMQEQQVDKLLLDLKRNAPPTDDEEHWLLDPLVRQLATPMDRPIFIAAVVSEGQYQYQISNYTAATCLPPQQVEFNYFTSRREAAAWLSTN